MFRSTIFLLIYIFPNFSNIHFYTGRMLFVYVDVKGKDLNEMLVIISKRLCYEED